MSQSIRIAVHMQPIAENGEPCFKATLPMGAFFEPSLDKEEVERARSELEEKYRRLVENLRAMRATLKEGNVLRNWMFGDTIVSFERETSQTLLFVDKLSDALARDIDYSKTMIDLCRRFRLKIPDMTKIDPRLSFSTYHRNGFDPKRAAASKRK